MSAARDISLKVSKDEKDNIFRGEVLNFVSESEFRQLYLIDINNDLSNYINTIKDLRATILIAALYIEKEIENILSCFFVKNFDDFLNSPEITFSTKIKILKTLNIMPKYILEAALGLKKVRDSLAHNIDIHFDNELLKPHIQALNSHLCNITDNQWKPTNNDLANIREFLIVLLGALKVYTSNFKKFGSYIRSEECLENFKATHEKSKKVSG